MNDTTPTTHTLDGSTAGSTAVADRPGGPPAETAAPPRSSVGRRLRSAPTGAKVAVGGAGLVVALLVGGVGGFAVGRATADAGGGQQPTGFQGGPGQQVPGQQPGGQLPQGQGVPDDQGLPDGTDVPGATSEQGTQTSWYVVPLAAPQDTAA